VPPAVRVQVAARGRAIRIGTRAVPLAGRLRLVADKARGELRLDRHRRVAAVRGQSGAARAKDEPARLERVARVGAPRDAAVAECARQAHAARSPLKDAQNQLPRAAVRTPASPGSLPTQRKRKLQLPPDRGQAAVHRREQAKRHRREGLPDRHRALEL